MASPMQPGGASDGWLQQKANQLVIGDQCLAWLPDKEIKKLAGEKWALMPESVANQPQIYQWLATFLASGYKIPAGGATPASTWTRTRRWASGVASSGKRITGSRRGA